MGSAYTITRNRNNRKIRYRVIKYKLHGEWKTEILGKVELATLGMAREILKDKERQIKKGKYGQATNQVPTLSEFSKEFVTYQRDVKQKRSWKKDASHLERWNKSFGSLRLSEITAKHIDDYKSNRLAEVKPPTVNRELEVLRTLFYLAKKWKKFFGENPVAESGLIPTESQSMRILTLEEEERLIASSSPHLIPIVQTALMTGMRKGEITSLRWEDVNLDSNLITIRASVSKSKKSRRIPISSTLRKILLEQRLKTAQAGYVFVTDIGIPYSLNNPGALKRAFSMACKRPI